MAEELNPIYYMRDNHTFKLLSGDVDTAIVEIEAEFNAGYTCGMLCSERPGFKNIHAYGNENRFKFFAECKQALQSALTPPAQPADGGEPLFILHCGQVDASGEQDEWEIEADSQKRVDDFCLQHPGQKAKLYTTPPASQEQGKWCEYVAGMVNCWVNSEWPHYMHMNEDRRVKAIAGIIERRLWALKQQPTPPAQSAVPEGYVPVPVEPTPEMLATVTWPECARTDWMHMLTAAPTPVQAPAAPSVFAKWWSTQGESMAQHHSETPQEFARRLAAHAWAEATRAALTAAPTPPAQDAEHAGLVSANGHLSTLLNESTQMLAQLRAMIDSLHDTWSNGGRPERGEFSLLDRVDDWLNARPSDMLEPQHATPAQPAVPEDVARPLIARSLAEWNEDDGCVTWWAWNGESRGWAGEAAYIGSPLCSDWPGYHTHWTPHPAVPAARAAEKGGA